MNNAHVDLENGGFSTEGGHRLSNACMRKNMWQLIEEAIKVELNVAEVYFSFHRRFQEDADFWWKMAHEEKSHAVLLMSGAQCFLDDGEFPGGIVGASLEALADMNVHLNCILEQEKSENPPSRAAALNLALKLEKSAGEMDYQHAMNATHHSSKILTLFQSLNEDEKDHANRIRATWSRMT